MKSKTAKTKKGFLKSRFNIYRSPASAAYRVDMALPGTTRTVGTAYVGELRPKSPSAQLRLLSGPVRALDATIASQDAEFADRLRQSADGEISSLLILTEVAPGKGGRAKHRFRGDILLASGRYVIEADFGPGEPFIAGRVSKQHQKISDSPAASSKGSSRTDARRKPGPKLRG